MSDKQAIAGLQEMLSLFSLIENVLGRFFALSGRTVWK